MIRNQHYLFAVPPLDPPPPMECSTNTTLLPDTTHVQQAGIAKLVKNHGRLVVTVVTVSEI